MNNGPRIEGMQSCAMVIRRAFWLFPSGRCPDFLRECFGLRIQRSRKHELNRSRRSGTDTESYPHLA